MVRNMFESVIIFSLELGIILHVLFDSPCQSSFISLQSLNVFVSTCAY